jgi:hypothetical protein
MLSTMALATQSGRKFMAHPGDLEGQQLRFPGRRKTYLIVGHLVDPDESDTLDGVEVTAAGEPVPGGEWINGHALQVGADPFDTTYHGYVWEVWSEDRPLTLGYVVRRPDGTLTLERLEWAARQLADHDRSSRQSG